MATPAMANVAGEWPLSSVAVIAAPVDVLGVNYYMPMRLSALADSPLPFQMEPIPGYPVTAFGWPVIPAALAELLVLLKDRYGGALPPVYITENGCSVADEVAADGSVDDQARIGYLDGHLRATRDAIEAGVADLARDRGDGILARAQLHAERVDA